MTGRARTTDADANTTSGTLDDPEQTAARPRLEDQFAEVIREALLLTFRPRDRSRHYVAATLMARASSGVILSALDAARSSAARGEAPEIVRSSFVRSLARAVPPSADSDDGGTVAEAGPGWTEEQIGPDAALLAEAAAEYLARAAEADGIDAEEQRRNARMANGLAGLSARHEVLYVGRDASPPTRAALIPPRG